MSLTAAQLFANVGVTGAAATVRGLQQVGTAVNTAHSKMGPLGTAATNLKRGLSSLVTTPLGILGLGSGAFALGLGLESAAKSAISFQASMALIGTQAGATQAEVDAMSKAVLALGPQVGTSAEELAAGLYHIESAGIRGAQALDILKTAAEGAKVGHADLESVTNALVASVTSGIKGTTSMAESMGVLNGIVGSGNMRMQDLTDAFSTGILATAKTFGVSMQSVGAAIADMTDQGVPATDAATRLRMTLSLLGAPTSKAVTELKKVGLSSLQLATDMRGPDGILGAVRDLKEHLDKSGLSATQQAQLISKAFGGGRSSSAIMTLLGSVDRLQAKQDAINKSTGSFGDAWAKTEATAAEKLAKFQATLNTLAITAGNVILPMAADLAESLTKTLGSPAAIGAITTFGNVLKTVIPGAIGTILGAWNAIPDPLKAFLVGGFVVNKITGGLVTKSASSVVSSLLGTVAGKLPGPLGAVAGAAAGVPHVWVDNMPLGGLGGAGGAAGAAAEAAGGIGAATLAGGALITGVAAAAVGAVYWLQRSGIDKQSNQIAAQTDAFTRSSKTTLTDLQASYAGVLEQQRQMNANPATQFGGLIFGANERIDKTLAELAAAIKAAGGKPGEAPGTPHIKPGENTQAEQARHAAEASLGLTAIPNAAQAAPGSSFNRLLALAAGGQTGGGASAVVQAATIVGEKFAKSSSPSTTSMVSALHSIDTLQKRFAAQGDLKTAAKLGLILNGIQSKFTSQGSILERIAAKKDDVHVTITPAPIKIDVNGRNILNALLVYRLTVDRGGYGGPSGGI